VNQDLFNNELNKATAKVLVVEDDELMRLTVCMFLTKSGYQVVTADNGLDAIDLVANEAPDIILMDAVMPKMDGFEATRHIRQVLGLVDIPIIMTTSYNDEENVNKAFDAGVTEFVSKPIHWAVLGNRLKYLWESIQKNEILSLAALVLENTTEGMIITDPGLRILASNSAFSAITGYSLEEALGKTPRLLQSGRHDKAFYDEMWGTLKSRGHWAGEIWNRRKNGEIYPEWLSISTVKNPAGRVTHYVAAFSDITTLKAREEHLEHLAHHDGLTGLSNRRLFGERLSQAIDYSLRTQQKMAVMYIDLDDFKPINDNYGHDVGDRVLQSAAQRLGDTIRRDDTASRLGGDEFGIILHNINDTRNAGTVADKIIQAMGAPLTIGDDEFMLGCSVGISIYPDDCEEAEGLIKLADEAMYDAKQAAKNQYRYWGSGVYEDVS